MLFAYKYVPHAMRKMQIFIDFIFFNVWCKAHLGEYDIQLFQRCKPLYQIMDEFYRQDSAGKLKDGAGKWFYESVNEIFNEFKQLDRAEIDKYRQFYKANNLIEELCSNIPGNSPIQYNNLNSVNDKLNSKLADFFKKLYSSGFFALSIVKKALGSDLDSYYVEFVLC